MTNAGTGTAHDVKLHVNLPAGLATTDGKKVVDASLGNIAQGQIREVVAHLKAARTGSYSTQAVVKSEGDTKSSDALSTAVRAPRLAVAVKGPEQDYVGKQLAYQVKVTNAGDAAARDAHVRVVTSDLGQVLTVNASGAKGTPESQATVARNGDGVALGTLAPGESRTLSATAAGYGGGMLTLGADATAACAERVTQSAQTRILTMAALLLEAVDESDPVRVGENVIYDVKVTNQGSGSDANVRVTATLPDEEQLVSAGGATEATVSGQTITFAPVATLASTQSVTWRVVAKAAAGSRRPVPRPRHQRLRQSRRGKDRADEAILNDDCLGGFDGRSYFL